MSQWVIEGSLGAILFNSQIITAEDIQSALAEQQRSGCRFGEALVRLGIVTAEDINWALSQHLDIPYIRLNREEMDPDTAIQLPERVARRFRAVPVIRIGDELRVALVDPLDREAHDEIQAACNCSVTISIADERDVQEMLDFLYGAEEKGAFGLLSSTASAAEAAEINADPTGERFMGWLISLLARKGYRSLTLMTTTGSGAVTGRQGVIHREVARLTGDACGRFVARLRSRAELTVSGAASRGEIEYVGEGGPLTVQVALLGGRDGEVVTLRRPELRHDIPFPIEAAPGLREVTSLPGLVVVALPTEATRRLVERLIVEQGAPGERLLLLGEGSPLLREKLPCIPLETLSSNDAATVIGEALEHGPDLLIIERCGDIRRLLAAARAALRGGRVVAGTGAGSAESLALIFTAWQRHHLIPAALRGIVVGEVIPTLCRSCREELSLSAEEAARLRLPLSPEGYRQSPGCTDCGFTGQGGSEFLVEVIPCDTPLIGLFERSGSSSDVAAALAARGEYRIPEKAARLLLSGEISPESYLRVVTG